MNRKQKMIKPLKYRLSQKSFPNVDTNTLSEEGTFVKNHSDSTK